MLHVTKDGGANWTEITIPNTGNGMVNQIEVSPHTPGTVYVAFNKYKYNDFTPHIFKSTDYGQTWTRLVDGIAEEAHVRVVREDPNHKDLLYAGTETGLYVSFDGGVKWNNFQRNLPIIPITDLMVNGNDLIIATQGRAFWVMDDLNPLYELKNAAGSDFYVYEPEIAIRDNAFRSTSKSIGQNPYPGFSIMYYIKDNMDTIPMSVEFMNADGDVVRSFSTDAKNRQERISKKSGMNRINWNLSLTNFDGVDGVFVGLGASGHRVAPGAYKVKINYGDWEVTKDLEVKADPRWSATDAQYAEQQRLLYDIRTGIKMLQEKANDIRSIRSQIVDLKSRIDSDEFESIHSKADEILKMINESEAEMVQPKQKTFQDVINFENKLEVQLLHIYGTIDGIEPPVTDGQKQRVEDLNVALTLVIDNTIAIEEGLQEFMKMIRDQEVPFIAPKKEKLVE